MAPQGNPSSTRAEHHEEWQERGNCNGTENKTSPYPGRSKWQKPPHNERKKSRGCRQSTAQVVENLPAADCWNSEGILLRPARLASSEKPGQELPVSASPSVLACCNRFITRRKFFKQLNIR